MSKSSMHHITQAGDEAVIVTETPFEQRHCCWFCGEPSNLAFIFPKNNTTNYYNDTKHLVLQCPHPTLSVPCCSECQTLANNVEKNSIWSIRHVVKQQLLKRHAKDLAIGVNWTPEELKNSEFEGGNFEGFAKSAWFIYEVAKSRVGFLGWPLVINGVVLINESQDDELEAQPDNFSFDGVVYPSLHDAISHYANIFKLDSHYLSAVLQQLSDNEVTSRTFAKTIRFCRLLINATPNERKVAFNQLVIQQSELYS